jgi:hypothetical protein
VSNRNLGRNAATYNSSVDIKIANGFIRLGHMVWDFSFRDTARALSWFGSKKGGAGRMNAALLETATNLKPDYIYMGHSELVTCETIMALRDRLPETRVSLTWQDSLYDNDYTHITERARLVHALFVSTGGPALQQFKSDGNRIAYFPNPVDPSIESLRQFERTNLPVDVLFCGRAKGRTINARNAFIHDLADRTAVSTDPAIRFRWHGEQLPLVFGDEYRQALAAAAMGLSVNRDNSWPACASARLWQLTGNGLLTLSPRVPDLELLFRPDEVAYFDDLDEAMAIIAQMIREPTNRQRIARAGWVRAHDLFGCTQVAKFLLAIAFGQDADPAQPWSCYTV